MIKIKQQINFDDFKTVNFELLKNKIKNKTIIIILLGFIYLFVNFKFKAISFIFIIPIFLYFINKGVKNSFNSNSKIQENIIYEFFEDKLKITGETYNGETNWDKIYKIEELKNYVLIYENLTSCYIIKKESFNEQYGEFKQIIKNQNNIKFRI
jgi:hypothetical protein